jgi:two-component system sensor histidine kinase HydH
MGIALLATVWSTHRSVSNASQTLIRGQTDLFHESIRVRLAELEGTVDEETAVTTIFAELEPEGLRYIATLRANGRVVAEAGAPLEAQPMDAGPADRGPDLGLRGPVEIGGRVRAVFRAPRRARAPRTADEREQRAERRRDEQPSDDTETRDGRARRWRRLPLIIEFEPRVATALRSAALRTLGVGALAAGALLAIALVLVRWFLRREALERQLEHERRLAGLGQMSAVLAHEIRNPLASLKGNAQLLARALPEGELPRRKADRVVDEAVRLERLTNDLLEFARLAELRRTSVDPTALAREVAEATTAGSPTGAPAGFIGIDSASAPAAWSMDRERMRQVLANLMSNAVQAGDGRVQVSVARADGQLVYEVRDHGAGIAEEDLGRIFEPFYTKRVRGTGLGLAVARRLVELHGGSIEADNAPGGGARFRVRIPPA